MIDFGTALNFDPDQQFNDTIGTPYYIAPEVLHRNYGKECDVWSTGVIAYIILSGTPPFNGMTDKEILRNISKGNYNFDKPVWQGVSDLAKDFITQLLKYNPKDRLSASEALQHQWIKEYSHTKLSEKTAHTALHNLIHF